MHDVQETDYQPELDDLKEAMTEHHGKWCCIEQVLNEASKLLSSKEYVLFIQTFGLVLSTIPDESIVDMTEVIQRFDITNSEA